MTNEKIVLLFDIDGVLVPYNDTRVPIAVQKICKKFKVKKFLASGKPLEWCWQIGRQINATGVFAENGLVYQHSRDAPKLAADLGDLEKLAQLISFQVIDEKRWVANISLQETSSPILFEPGKHILTFWPEPRGKIKERAISSCAISEADFLREVKNLSELNRLNIKISGPYKDGGIDLLPIGVDKGKAVEVLEELFPNFQIIAFVDDDNDAPIVLRDEVFAVTFENASSLICDLVAKKQLAGNGLIFEKIAFAGGLEDALLCILNGGKEMDMREIIRNFNQQFLYEPAIENEDNLRLNRVAVLHNQQKFIAVGMGGSHLAGDIARYLAPQIPILIHKDYGLPQLDYGELMSSQIIIVSHSGNTEEVLDVLDRALHPSGRMNKLHVAVIASGGKLLETAEKEKLPYIKIPDVGMPPRCATGFMTRALMKLMGADRLFQQTGLLAHSLDPNALESAGEELARNLRGKIPLIYSSAQNETIAQNWKIRLNETAKVPAFSNVFPELNHNEMNAVYSDQFRFVFLKDSSDHPRVQKRMSVLEEIYHRAGLGVECIPLEEKRGLYAQMWPIRDMASIESACRMQKVFSAIVLADWTAYYLAQFSGTDPLEIPMIEEFKKVMEEN